MPILDYMHAHDLRLERAVWLEKRAERAGYRMDRTPPVSPLRFRLRDAELGHTVVESLELDDIEAYLNE
ncbi:hypothetical protein [Nocardia wallacei]|uniref:hypothetical protein n=1 Tax=Nocardia wallacei TaxID=480035 RepID=UPI00245778FE|nr:hypothetical protein [Nocardia wallacei]